MFSNPFPNAFGLDIGDRSIKVVQLKNVSKRKTGPAYKFSTANSISLSEGLIVNGELLRPEIVRNNIKTLLDEDNKKRKRKIKSPWVVANLSNTQGFLKLITLNKEPKDIAEEDIISAAQKHIPFDIDSSYVDWQFFPNGNDKESARVLIATIPKNIADSFIYLLESLGLGVIAMEHEAIAIARAMITSHKMYNNESRAILDIGATRSSLVFYDHEIIQAYITLEYSGKYVNNELVDRYNLSPSQAEELKRAHGLNFAKKQDAIWEVMYETGDELVHQIKKAIRFYYSHFPDANKVTRITMCGGGSFTKRMDTYLTEKLGITCAQGNPLKNLNFKQEIPMPTSLSHSYATAIGLALRASDSVFKKYDDI